jgi:hypothetical protein
LKIEYGRCEECLSPVFPETAITGHERTMGPCKCGHTTPVYEALKLQRSVRPIGIREAAVQAKADIQAAIETVRKVKRYCGQNICRGPALGNVSSEDLIGAITIDMQKIAQDPYVEELGVAKLRSMIERSQREITNTYGIELNFIQAATILANIYEPQSGALGDIVCQKGKDSFYLGEDIAVEPLFAAITGSDSLEYIKLIRMEPVKIVMGEASTKFVPVGGSRYVMRVDNPKLPLVLARRPEGDELGKLFIFT